MKTTCSSHCTSHFLHWVLLWCLIDSNLLEIQTQIPWLRTISVSALIIHLSKLTELPVETIRNKKTCLSHLTRSASRAAYLTDFLWVSAAEKLESKHTSHYLAATWIVFMVITFYWKTQFSASCGARSLTGPCSWNSALILQILWRDPGYSSTVM